MRHITRLAAIGITGLMTLVGCSSSNDTPTVDQSAGQATSTTAAAPGSTATSTAAATTTTAAATATTAAATATKVNANTATQAQIQAALEANGVSNASRWAGEVVEYRPYPTNDPNLAKLRQNLVKYNPGPGVVDQIVASLSV
jgi:uncharacterized protein YcfL